MNLESIKTITTNILQDKDVFLVDAKVSKLNVIEIFIDAINGVNLQTCIEVSRLIEEQLDRDEEDFELTVASAGIGYPFKVEGQFQKCLGKDVEIIYNDGTKQIAILKGFDNETISIEWTEKQKLEGKKRKEDVLVKKTVARNTIKTITEYI